MTTTGPEDVPDYSCHPKTALGWEVEFLPAHHNQIPKPAASCVGVASKVRLPGIDDRNTHRNKGFSISGGYGKSMRRRNRCDLTVRHGNRAASRPGSTDQARIYNRGRLIEWQDT